jgi:hypothetical protein
MQSGRGESLCSIEVHCLLEKRNEQKAIATHPGRVKTLLVARAGQEVKGMVMRLGIVINIEISGNFVPT